MLYLIVLRDIVRYMKRNRTACAGKPPHSHNPISRLLRTGVLVDGGATYVGPVETKRDGSCGFAVWFTGMPCTGKTTTSRMLEQRMNRIGVSTHTISLDSLRKELAPPDVDPFSKDPDIKRIIYEKAIARLWDITRTGGSIIVDTGTSAEWLRRWVKQELPNAILVHLYCDLATQLFREVKRSLSGDAHVRENWILFKAYRDLLLDKKEKFPQPGVTYPFEFPFSADLHINTFWHSTDETVDTIISMILKMRVDTTSGRDTVSPQVNKNTPIAKANTR